MFNTGAAELQNTILALNTLGESADASGPDCDGPLTSLGGNFIGDLSDCAVTLQTSDLTGEPGLGEFVDTGFPGGGHIPLLPDSPAINAGNVTACLATDQLGTARVGICDMGAVEFGDGTDGKLLVSIGLRPKGEANNINPNSARNVNVAVFSSAEFDPSSIDPNTVRFGATGNEAVPIHVGRSDVNGDGARYLIFRFMIQDIGIKCGDTSTTLTGQTADGRSFSGSSAITTRCRRQQQTASVGSR
jgi:hypothetical protein